MIDKLKIAIFDFQLYVHKYLSVGSVSFKFSNYASQDQPDSLIVLFRWERFYLDIVTPFSELYDDRSLEEKAKDLVEEFQNGIRQDGQ